MNDEKRPGQALVLSKYRRNQDRRGTTRSILKRYHRNLDRRVTARQIAAFGIATIAAVLVTLFWRFGFSLSLDGRTLPALVTFAGLVVIFVQALLLWLLIGTVEDWFAHGVKALYILYFDVFKAILRGEAAENSEVDMSAKAQMPRWVDEVLAKDHLKVYSATRTWYGLVGLGILGQAMVIAGTGGMAASPFSQILIATFIIGQYRANTLTGVWALFWAAVVSATAAHGLFIYLQNRSGNEYESISFIGRYYVPAGLLVALASTLVYVSQVEKEAVAAYESVGGA